MFFSLKFVNKIFNIPVTAYSLVCMWVCMCVCNVCVTCGGVVILPLEDDRVTVWVLEISLPMAMSALT